MSHSFFAVHFLIDDFIAEHDIAFHAELDYYYTVGKKLIPKLTKN